MGGISVGGPPSGADSQRPAGSHPPDTAYAAAALALPPSSAVDPELGSRLFPNEYSESGQSPNLTGVRLDHFELKERIGVGGMGAVFKAIDLRLQRVVALKVLSPSQSRDSSSTQRFQNEAQAGARFDHENIARVYHVGQDRGIHYIAFEFVEGVNLRDLIRAQGKLDPGEAISYTLQIAAALRHTNAAGVVHRDIKPSNILITPNGRAKLVDLGLARTQAAALPDGPAPVELTMAGTTLGTFDYISPEQARDPRHVDIRSDIYSLGCTLYHMLAGEAPYPEGTVLQKLLDHQGGDTPDPAAKNRHVSADLSAIVRRMMASDPRRRFATPEELIQQLLPLAGQLGLRAMSGEGLIWTGSRSTFQQLRDKHLPWVLTASILLAVVLILDRYPSLSQNVLTPRDSADARSNASVRTNRGSGDSRASTDGYGKPAGMVGLAGDGSPAEARQSPKGAGTYHTGPQDSGPRIDGPRPASGRPPATLSADRNATGRSGDESLASTSSPGGPSQSGVTRPTTGAAASGATTNGLTASRGQDERGSEARRSEPRGSETRGSGDVLPPPVPEDGKSRPLVPRLTSADLPPGLSSPGPDLAVGPKLPVPPAPGDSVGKAGPSSKTGAQPKPGLQPKPGSPTKADSTGTLADGSVGKAPNGTGGTGGPSATTVATAADRGAGDPSRFPDSGSERSPKSDRPTTDARPGAEARTEPKPSPIVVLPLGGGDSKPYPTLEAACAEADDGQIIELRYNGPREPEKPFRIAGRKLTIRGAKGYRPIVEFVVKDAAAPGQSTRMITVSGGSLELSHLELRLTVADPYAVKDGEWASLVQVGGAEQVRFQSVAVTVSNPGNRAAAVVEVAPAPGAGMAKMKMMAGAMTAERPRYVVEFVDSFLRGNVDVAAVRHTNAGAIDFDQSAVSVDGALVALFGAAEPPAPEALLRVQLKHVTAAVGNGLVRVDSGTEPRELAPVSVHARNNLFGSRTPVSLVTMSGSTNVEDFRRLLRWHGEKNFYDRFDAFWTISTPQGASDFDNRDFDAWKKIWSAVPETSEVGAVRGGLSWKERWWERTAREASPADFELLDDDSTALGGATDGSDPGAALNRLATPAQSDAVP